MAIVCGTSMLVAVVRRSSASVQPWRGEAAVPTRRSADGLVQLATVLRHRAAKAVPAGELERSITPALRYRRPSSVMGRTGVEAARESTARARRSAG